MRGANESLDCQGKAIIAMPSAVIKKDGGMISKIVPYRQSNLERGLWREYNMAMIAGLYYIFILAAAVLGIYVTILMIKALNIYIKKNS